MAKPQTKLSSCRTGACTLIYLLKLFCPRPQCMHAYNRSYKRASCGFIRLGGRESYLSCFSPSLCGDLVNTKVVECFSVGMSHSYSADSYHTRMLNEAEFGGCEKSVSADSFSPLISFTTVACFERQCRTRQCTRCQALR